MVDEMLIHRARRLLGVIDFQYAVEHLVEAGVSREDAYLAVHAARLLNESR